MSSPYRTKSIFDFEDEYGADPIISRYGATPSRARSYELRAELAGAKRLDAEAELAQAQAEEEAKLAPLRAVSERFKVINDLSSERSRLEEDARRRTAEANLNEQLPKTGNILELDKLVAENAEVALSPVQMERINLARSKFKERDKADLRTKLPNVMAPEDVDKWELWAAERQLLGDQEVQAMLNIWRGVAVKKGSAMKGLTQLGAQSMPVTPQGEFDVSRAENIVETLGRTDIRTLSAAQRGIQKQLEDPMLDPEGPDAQALQSDLTNINRQIAGITSRSDQQTTRAAMDLQSLGGTNPDWIDEIIGGGGGRAPDSPSTAAPATASGSAPATDSPAPTRATPSPQTDSAEPEKKEKQKPYDPKDRAELARLELEVQKAREEAGLMNQPAGIRQINEALAAQNAPVREKVAQLEAAQERINPFAEANAKDAQTIQAALDVVYPEMDGGGFDVGSAEDSRVVSAAEFLRRVDPSLLRMVASSPGSNRAGLSLEEISNIAAKAIRSARGRKQK